MLRQKTVFILGAGASKEVGLPIGEELKDTIATKLEMKCGNCDDLIGGDRHIFTALRQRYPSEINRYLEACRQIHDGIMLSWSIDDFIDTHRHDEAIAICGKLGIARSILEAEQNSKL